MTRKGCLVFARLLLLLSYFCIPVVYASFEKGYELYKEKKFDDALQIFKSLTEIGDYSAMFNLGVMYYRGESVEKDPIVAYAWMHTAGTILKSDQHLKSAGKVFSSLGETEKKEANKRAETWLSLYAPSEIEKRIFPKPLSDKDCTPDPTALKIKQLNYPIFEVRRGVFGRVEIEFTISKEGYVRDLVVNNSNSRNFTKNAVRTMKKSRYEPQTLGGNPIYYYGHRVLVTFRIEGATVNAKKVKVEIEEYKQKAESGDPVAQYVYARKLNVFRSFRIYLEKLNLEYQEANKWYLASAKKGLPHAQFILGRNMIRGRGCEIDEENGIKWINAAAAGGYSPAQHYIAQGLVNGAKEKAHKTAITWLRNAALSDHYPSKLLLAWELSTSPNDKLRNGEESLALLKAKPESYYDNVRIFETYAAAYAEIGDFKKAIQYQKKAIEETEDLEWNIAELKARLSAYMSKHPWRGRYYPSAQLTRSF